MHMTESGHSEIFHAFSLSSLTDCEKISVPALEGVRQLILGSVHANSGHVRRARQCYESAIRRQRSEDDDNTISVDTHAAAFAAYELGLLLCRTAEVCNNTDTHICIFSNECNRIFFQTRKQGRRYLEFARDNYQGYDFESRLSVRIHAALRFYSENASERHAQALISG